MWQRPKISQYLKMIGELYDFVEIDYFFLKK